MNSFMATPSTIERKWYVVDATDKTLGRLASEVAKVLRGKHKPTYTPHMDCGDYVIVINADKVKLTGKKMEQKVYFSHSGYAKGAKETPVKRVLEKNPTRVLELAVKRMLDENKLRAPRMKRLRLFAGEEHAFTERFGK